MRTYSCSTLPAMEFRPRPGGIDLNLHVESDTPNQGAVCSRIRELLRSRERQILATCGVRLSEKFTDGILKGELPPTSLTAKSLAEVIERMAMTESFVDEALYLADKEQVHRTDFLGKGYRPDIEFHGKMGGWEFCSSGGRFNSPSLRCRGDAFNWFDSEDTNILVLHPTMASAISQMARVSTSPRSYAPLAGANSNSSRKLARKTKNGSLYLSRRPSFLERTFGNL